MKRNKYICKDKLLYEHYLNNSYLLLPRLR